MTQAQVIQEIQQWIVTNGNNEITANVLQPILVDMINQPNSLIGNLQSLNTTNKSNLVEAINEIANNSGGGVTIHSGSADPNITPPNNFGIADFYQRIVNWETVGLYIFNGVNWFLLAQTQSSGYTTSAKVILNDYTVKTGDHTIVYITDSPINVFMPPANAVNEGREIRLVNRSPQNMTLDINYKTSYLNVENEVFSGTSAFLQAISGTWYKIN